MSATHTVLKAYDTGLLGVGQVVQVRLYGTISTSNTLQPSHETPSYFGDIPYHEHKHSASA